MVGVKDSVGVQVDKSLLRALLVPVERQAPSAPMDSRGCHLWQLAVGRRSLWVVVVVGGG